MLGDSDAGSRGWLASRTGSKIDPRKCVDAAIEAGVEYLTLYAFSSENVEAAGGGGSKA